MLGHKKEIKYGESFEISHNETSYFLDIKFRKTRLSQKLSTRKSFKLKSLNEENLKLMFGHLLYLFRCSTFI
jgi:hypothetical protein